MKKSKINQKSIFARNITARRKAMGLNQEQFADKVGVHLNTVKYIETDRSEGSPENRRAIAEALGCSLSDLYRDDEMDSAIPDVLGASSLLAKFASLSPLRQRIVLGIIYDDSRYVLGLDSSDLPQSLSGLIKTSRK